MRRSGLIVVLTVVALAGCTGDGGYVSTSVPTTPSDRSFPTEPAPGEIVVPDVEGLPFPEARAALEGAGLGVLPVYLADDDVARGIVLETIPSPGASVDQTTSVEVWVSAGRDRPGEFGWVVRVFKHHRGAFVGYYRGPDSQVAVAIGSDADWARWAEELEAASEGRPFALVQCERTASELRRIDREIFRMLLAGELEPFFGGGGVEARNCSVTFSGQFTPSLIARLHAMYGDAVTIVDGVPPAQLD